LPDPRHIIRERAAERGLSFSALSIMAGRNVAYVQQFVERGTPRHLPDEPRRLLAIALDLDETLLGARMPWMPAVGSLGHA
jgi:cyanate lyase